MRFAPDRSVAMLQLLAAVVASPEGYSAEFGYPATFAALFRRGLIDRIDGGARYVATEAGRAAIEKASGATPQSADDQTHE